MSDLYPLVSILEFYPRKMWQLARNTMVKRGHNTRFPNEYAPELALQFVIGQDDLASLLWNQLRI